MSVDVIGQDPAAFDSDDPVCHGSNGLIVRNDDDCGMTLAAQIMEELQNILAFGSGSVSRFVYPDENRIEKLSNIKNLEEYINRTQDMINKKRSEMK